VARAVDQALDTGASRTAARGSSGTIVGVDGIRRWLRLWHVDRVELTSPLSLAEVQAVLSASVETRRYAAWRAAPSAGSHVLVGRLNDRRVRLSANPPGTTNGWNAVLRGELVPLANGCRLSARLGWLPKVRVFTAVWLSAALSFSLLGVVLLAVSLAHGDGAGGYLPMCLVPVASVAFGVGMVGVLGARGRDNARVLRDWLQLTLRASEGGDHALDGPIHLSH
jgi:hypothetical protein